MTFQWPFMSMATLPVCIMTSVDGMDWLWAGVGAT
jgi:hypothetical protein